MLALRITKMQFKDLAALIHKDGRKKIFTLLESFEWSGFHPDYEAVMTRVCPFCLNAKGDGHKADCVFKSISVKELEENYQKASEVVSPAMERAGR